MAQHLKQPLLKANVAVAAVVAAVTIVVAVAAVAVVVAVVTAVVMADMVGEAVGIVGTATAPIPIIPIIMVGPTPIMVAATAMSMKRTLVVERGKLNSLSSPPTRVLARMLNHRQVPVASVVDRMEPALGITALRILAPPLCVKSILM